MKFYALYEMDNAPFDGLTIVRGKFTDIVKHDDYWYSCECVDLFTGESVEVEVDFKNNFSFDLFEVVERLEDITGDHGIIFDLPFDC